MAIVAVIALVVYAGLLVFFAAAALRQSLAQALLVLLLPFYLHYFALLRTQRGVALRSAPTVALVLALLVRG